MLAQTDSRSLLARLRSSDAAAAHAHKYTGFVVAGERVGQVQTSLVGLLLACSGPSGPCFEQLDGAIGLVQSVYPTAEERSVAMAAATQHLIAHQLISHCHGDLYPIAPAWNAPALCVVDRNAAPFFGTTSVGVHLHCYVRTHAGLQLWVAQRAADKATYPGQSSLVITPLAVPHTCASSARAWWLRAVRHSQSEAQPLGARPPPRGLERAASKVADFTAFDP